MTEYSTACVRYNRTSDTLDIKIRYAEDKVDGHWYEPSDHTYVYTSGNMTAYIDDSRRTHWVIVTNASKNEAPSPHLWPHYAWVSKLRWLVGGNATDQAIILVKGVSTVRVTVRERRDMKRSNHPIVMGLILETFDDGILEGPTADD